MLRKTGPGKFYRLSTNPNELSLLLWNFDIDGDTVKPEHQRVLEKELVSFLDYITLLGSAVRVTLTGHTSASGSKSYNLFTYEKVVQEYVKWGGPPPAQAPATLNPGDHSRQDGHK